MSQRFREILETPPSALERITFTFAVIGVWSLVAWSGLISPLIVPSPIAVVKAANNIGTPLVWHTAATTLRCLIGLSIGTALGIFLGLVVRYSRVAKLMIEPLLDASRPVPAIALLPFFILIFGFSETGRVVLVASSVTIIVAVAVAEIAEALPESWFRFALVSGLPRYSIFLRIVVPGLTPWLRGPLRVALGLSFTLVIASEFMGAQQGLGYLINVARVNLATPTIVLCIIILGIVAQLTDTIISLVIGHYSFWYQGARSAEKTE